MSRRKKWSIDEHMEKIRARAVRGLSTLGLEAQRMLKMELSKPGGGRVYRLRGGRLHIAAAPGQPPAVRTGNLRRSVQIDSSGLSHKTKPSIVVGPGAHYGKYLEPDHPFMAPIARRMAFRARQVLSIRNLMR